MRRKMALSCQGERTVTKPRVNDTSIQAGVIRAAYGLAPYPFSLYLLVETLSTFCLGSQLCSRLHTSTSIACYYYNSCLFKMRFFPDRLVLAHDNRQLAIVAAEWCVTTKENFGPACGFLPTFSSSFQLLSASCFLEAICFSVCVCGANKENKFHVVFPCYPHLAGRPSGV